MAFVTRKWRSYLLALALVALMTLIGALLGALVAPANLVMLYLAAVVVVAMRMGRGPAVMAAFVSVIVFDFFIVPPRHTFAVADTQYLLTFAGLLVVGLVISSLAGEAREQAEAARRREAEAIALWQFSRDLSGAGERAAIFAAVIDHVCQAFDRDAAVLLPEAGKGLAVVAASPAFTPSPDDCAAAERLLELDDASSQASPTAPVSDVPWLPLRTPRGVVGVLAVAPGGDPLMRDRARLLETFASQAALAIERAQLAERAQQALLLEATEKLYSALLNSVSHDLRTPLVTITGAFSALEAGGERMDGATRASLARAGREEAERLNRFVGNLLDMTRIEAGALRVTEEPADVGEAIGVVLERLAGQLKERRVVVEVPLELPPVPMDMPLIVQALVNVVDNAAKFSPEDAPIDIRALQAGDCILVKVADRGVGIPAGDLEHVFDRFYRVRRPNGAGGTGLGLAISKGIVEAHSGSIEAASRPDGGTVVTIRLPLQLAPVAGG